MQYELAPTELLEVVDALLFRANALERDKQELATDLRKLAMRFLGTSTRLKQIASRDAQALAHKPPTVEHCNPPNA
jgi:hypothetical protein